MEKTPKEKREIKFRGRDFVTGSWAYGFYYPSKGQSIIRDEQDKECIVITKTVGQFTGLYDKNGKEIYEGDICKRILDKKNKYKHKEEWADFFLIEWLYKTAGFTTTCIGDLHNGKFISKISNQNSFSQRFNEMDEVIGNIYENPNLLN